MRVEVKWISAWCSCRRMRARKYGSPKDRRAPKTASALEASSEKNQTPGTPSTCTYVHVELMRLTQHGKRGKEDGPYSPHGECGHAHPGPALEGVEAQPGGDQRLQKLCRNG